MKNMEIKNGKFDTLINQISGQLERSKPTILALTGELGSGKTTFTKALAKKLGIQDHVISPTFIICREYPIHNTKRIIYHIDLYRIEDENELDELNIKKMLKENDIVVIEWADKFRSYIDNLKNMSKIIWINFEHIDENTRKVQI